nr:hypothetical protein GCM10020092_028170 [Actinoplanes digitatis]
MNEACSTWPSAAAGHRDLRLGLEERLAGSVDVLDDAADAGRLPLLAEDLGAGAAQRGGVPVAEQLRVRVVVDKHVVVAVGQRHRHGGGEEHVDRRADDRIPRLGRPQRGGGPGVDADPCGAVDGGRRRSTGLVGQRGHR